MVHQNSNRAPTWPVRGCSVAMIRLNCAPLVRLKFVTAFEFSALCRSNIAVRRCPRKTNALSTRAFSTGTDSDRFFRMSSMKNVCVPALGSDTAISRAYGHPLCTCRSTPVPIRYGHSYRPDACACQFLLLCRFETAALTFWKYAIPSGSELNG